MLLVHEMLTQTELRTPEHPVLISGGEVTTFRELTARSTRLAATLQRCGLSRGERVVIVMENSATLVESLFGALMAGGVFVVVNPTTKADKLAYILNDCAASAVIASARLAAPVAAALAESPTVRTTVWVGDVPASLPHGLGYESVTGSGDARPADPGLIDADLAGIIYTSGSTGRPKGVMLTHRNVCHNAWSISTYLGMTGDDVVACLLPLSFDYGLFQIFMAVRLGCTVLLERSFAYPADVMKRVVEHRVTGFPGVPTIFSTLLGMKSLEGLDLSHVRFITNTAAALPPAHIVRLGTLFPQARIFSMYGLTECTRVSYLDPDRLADKIGSVGKAMPNTEVYLVDADGRRVPPGGAGELVVRGASVMRGYWGNPEVTAQWLRPGEIQGEIVLYTGDQFRTDDEGFLYFVGRSDDIFKCKGEKISPKEIEQVLYELDEIEEAAVVGVEDDIDGMAIKAVVSASGRGQLDERLVRSHCRARLEAYMIPKHIEIRDSLPKTDSGKIRRQSVG
jgi:long-chain acyl-CoA synthetase